MRTAYFSFSIDIAQLVVLIWNGKSSASRTTDVNGNNAREKRLLFEPGYVGSAVSIILCPYDDNDNLILQ